MKIQGESIYLRPYHIDDAEVVFAGVNEPIGKKLTGTHATFTMDQIIRYIENNATDDERAGFVICRLDDRVVGEVVINDIDRDNRSANIRIAIYHPDDFGQGYGSEAMRLAIAYGFEEFDLHRLELGVFAFNPRAIHVYEKVGFKLEGTRRDALFYDGEYHDEHVMGLLAGEWRK